MPSNPRTVRWRGSCSEREWVIDLVQWRRDPARYDNLVTARLACFAEPRLARRPAHAGEPAARLCRAHAFADASER